MTYIYCSQCGYKNKWGNIFCEKCGRKIAYPHTNKSAAYSKKPNDSVIDSATKTINSWTGENEKVQINLSSFFSQIWKRHTEDQAEEIFIAGTKSTTPSLSEISSRPVQPWLYTRVLAFVIISAALLGLLCIEFNNNVILALEIAVCFSVPISLTVFFFEVNVFKNISFYTVIKIMVIGGIFSLIVTMCIYTITGSGDISFIGSFIIGFVEETGKILVGAYFISQLKLNHIFNGMLVGGAIGAGFAAFENVQYATNLQSTIMVPIIRSLCSFGTHSIWCAITVSALVLAKGNKPLTWNNIANHKFFNFYFFVILLHALWDWSLPFEEIKYIILICIAWLILFVLIHSGLREVKQLQM